MEEIWKPIRDWPDYTISNLGKIYSVRRDRLLKQSLDSHGYPNVNLCRNKEWRRIPIHRLVALEFVEGYFDGAEINHIDGNKQNAVAINLEWVTHKQNCQHAIDTGLNPTRKEIVRDVDGNLYEWDRNRWR